MKTYDREPLDDGWTCKRCGTRVKPGQPHRAALPEPHVSLKALLGPKGHIVNVGSYDVWEEE
jgi:hypothetical protein